MAQTAYIVWNTKNKCVMPGSPFPSAAGANAHINNRLVRKKGTNDAATFEVIAVTL
jgi:hypothetical protein